MEEFVDVETARRSGREGFGKMLAYLAKHEGTCRTILVEKTDRLYRNLKDWVTIDDLGLTIHFVKENNTIGPDSRSSEQLMHGIRVLMARNYSQNLGEETIKGMTEKARSGLYPSNAPVGYRNVEGPNGKRSPLLGRASTAEDRRNRGRDTGPDRCSDRHASLVQRSVVSGRTEPEGFASGDQNKESQARPSANTTHRRLISA
jgi:DNA invertase Pin-like site-specific DNA recombinase